VDCIQLAQNRDQWWAVVNMVSKLPGSIKDDKFIG
jgi:hypothetical protein